MGFGGTLGFGASKATFDGAVELENHSEVDSTAGTWNFAAAVTVEHTSTLTEMSTLTLGTAKATFSAPLELFSNSALSLQTGAFTFGDIVNLDPGSNLDLGAGTVTFGGEVFVASTAAIFANAPTGATVTVKGALDGSGNVDLTGASFTFAGTGNFSGTLSDPGGTIKANGNVILPLAKVDFSPQSAGSDATFDLAGHSVTVNALSFSGCTLTVTAGTLKVYVVSNWSASSTLATDIGCSVTFNAGLNGSASTALTIEGSGSVTVAGDLGSSTINVNGAAVDLQSGFRPDRDQLYHKRAGRLVEIHGKHRHPRPN